ncbi:CLUMA_CG015781, isoform A [Clunio marinus]|uniref:CLUMA_CG015781, isoform A n=1 Tax=Clunio marinus TaxID=568069 RepID=A0A1J1ITI2_9DIPT|nr:CLUMA_CG015781, isoform A [Clunio marinus]
MSLSKPVYNFLGFYFEQLFNNPIRTKSITSSVIATAGAITSQKLSGQPFNPNAVFAYTAFGAFVAGPFAHYFYEFISRIVPDVPFRRILEFLLERFTYAPIFCALSLYFLTIFEGKTPDQATQNVLKLYRTVLLANWRYLTLPVFLNFNFVPPMLRVFVSNIIGFFWVIYMADKRRRAAAAAKKEK